MRTNAITKILANDKEYTKSALASLDLESFKAIDKAMEKLDYEDLGELADKANEIIEAHSESVMARYTLGAIAFVRRPHEDNIFMQNLLISFYDVQNWPAVEFLCQRILAYNENRYALRMLADCYEETGREDEKWSVLERLVKVDFDEKKLTRLLGDHFNELGDREKALLYYRRTLTRAISSHDGDTVKAMWAVLLPLQGEDYGYFLGIAEKVATSVDKALALCLLTELYSHYSNDTSKAILILKKALEIDPHSSQAREALVKSYKAKYAKSSRLAECLKKSRLSDPNEDIAKAIAFFETIVGAAL